MAASPEFIAHLTDLLEPFGPVQVRRMFGGAGVFREGLMFGLIADDVLYLKVDDRNQPDFEAAGTGPFVYDGKGKPVSMSYYRLPDEVMEDTDALANWARGAYEAALRADAGKRRKKRK